MKSTYWSCSKFADWLRGTPTLPCGTSKEWSDWKKTAQKKPIRYWLAEEGLDYLQNFICWPAHRMNDVRFYINNRWITKNHALTSNLRRGQWHDFDERLLHAGFDELVNFVEIEQAWMHVVCSDEERKKYNPPWYRTIFRIRLWRCPAAGLAYLDWAAGLVYEDEVEKNDPNYGQPTFQALAAQETLALYHWWKMERPARPDPHDASGWTSYYNKRRAEAQLRGQDFLESIFNADKSDDDQSRVPLEICRKMEEDYDAQDTEMLIRLIKIRHSLWT